MIEKTTFQSAKLPRANKMPNTIAKNDKKMTKNYKLFFVRFK